MKKAFGWPDTLLGAKPSRVKKMESQLKKTAQNVGPVAQWIVAAAS